jgi:DNA-binding response OmpR family regulator
MLKPRILVVDDEEPIRKTLRMALEYEGNDVFEAS